jgi:hypothetical protein
MIRIFAGYDPREAIGYHVFCQSLIERTSEPVAITPLVRYTAGRHKRIYLSAVSSTLLHQIHWQGNIYGCQRYADAVQH